MNSMDSCLLGEVIPSNPLSVFLQIICLWFPSNIMNLIIVVLWIVLIHYGNSPFAIHLGALNWFKISD